MRLKIPEWSKNYHLKIPVRVRVYARMYARAHDCQDSTRPGPGPGPGHDRNTSAGKGRNTEKPAYIGMITGNEKKYKKKLKKICN